MKYGCCEIRKDKSDSFWVIFNEGSCEQFSVPVTKQEILDMAECVNQIKLHSTELD
jgi:hypothetical protein